MRLKLVFILLVTLWITHCPGQQKVCLNMIVKNESAVIERCLASVLPLIDCWVIVDTGSTDGTQDIIKNYLKDVPGTLYERPWINFGYNRNEALELCKGEADYILFIDADETLSYPANYKLPRLTKDFYFIITQYGGTTYGRVNLIRDALPWSWVGVLHETLVCHEARSNAVLKNINNIVHTDGARSKNPNKYQEDAALLEAALDEDPTNTRYAFYLAQSYKDAGLLEEAIDAYRRRVDMGGWDQEVFWSLLQIGILTETLDYDFEAVIDNYLSAYYYRPTRAEPLYRLASYYRRAHEYQLAYFFAHLAGTIPLSQDVLFVEKWIYDFGVKLEQSISAYWIGNYSESLQLSLQLLEKPDLPDNFRQCIENNLVFIYQKLNMPNPMVAGEG